MATRGSIHVGCGLGNPWVLRSLEIIIIIIDIIKLYIKFYIIIFIIDEAMKV